MSSSGLSFLPKQVELMNCSADQVLYGGARGGAKTFGSAAAMALSPGEVYGESDFLALHLNPKDYRVRVDEAGNRIYFRYLIDYPYYVGAIVRRSRPQLRANTLVETGRIYRLFGGTFDRGDYCWMFPSGATIYLRPLSDDSTSDFFQGPSFQRLCIEELTQFDKEMVEKVLVSCRSTPPIGGGYQIPARIIFTSNPGGRGHNWVKETFVDKCPPQPDGELRYVDEFDLAYQPLRSGEPYVNEYGESFLFIPSLVFDNPYLVENDRRYVRHLNSMNPVIRSLWLLGRWDVNVGQYFNMWDESIHVIDEFDFFNITKSDELVEARRRFDWKGKGYRLFLSNDYGFSSRSAWACLAFAVDNHLNVYQFAEIVESGLTISQQADYTMEFFKKNYDLSIDDFELVIADPKSYWQKQDRGDVFFSFYNVYLEKGIYLTKGNNDRVAGAAAVADMLKMNDEGKAKLRFLNNCQKTIDTISTIPADPKKPDDVDTTVFDHPYDALRYFVMIAIYENSAEKRLDNKKKDWRDGLRKDTSSNFEEPGEVKSYLTV